MRIPKSCVYAVQTVLYLALVPPDRPYVPVRRVAADLEISPTFLVKILQGLVREGIVRTYRGPRGGLALAREPDEITLMDIARATGHEGLFEACVLGLDGCGEEAPCPLHDDWEAVRRRMRTAFRMTDVARLRDAVRAGRMRIADAVAVPVRVDPSVDPA